MVPHVNHDCRPWEWWLILMLVAMTLNLTLGAEPALCQFKVIDEASVEPQFTTKGSHAMPLLLKGAFPWRSEFATEEFARANLGDINIQLTESIELQSQVGFVPSAISMSILMSF
jgi:hypothetical protein